MIIIPNHIYKVWRMKWGLNYNRKTKQNIVVAHFTQERKEVNDFYGFNIVHIVICVQT